MKITRQTIRGSPYIGVFCCITEKIGLIPFDLGPKENKNLESLLGIEIIQTKLAESSLLGILAAGNSNGFVAGEIATDHEIKELEKKGIRIKKISGISAIGNLMEANDSRGMCSEAIKPKTRKEIEGFLKIELKTGKIAGTDLIGSCVVATNKGFVINPNATEKEISEAKKAFELEGKATTANYGDVFLGNSIAANTKAAIAGENTSGTELMRIEEGLNG